MASKTVDNGTLTDYDVATGTGAVDGDTQRVTLASDDPAVALLGTIDADTGSIAASLTLSGTPAVTTVSDTATSATLLSSSGTRKGFRITNTSSAVLFVKYGATASASDFTARLPQYAYLEENFYSGRVDGIWATDPNDGAALITGLSA